MNTAVYGTEPRSAKVKKLIQPCMIQSQDQLLQLKNEHGRLYYFNKRSAATVKKLIWPCVVLLPRSAAMVNE